MGGRQQSKRLRADNGTRVPCPGCDGSRKPGNALCGRCWSKVPAELRERLWATRPHSNARRAALRDVYAHVIEHDRR